MVFQAFTPGRMPLVLSNIPDGHTKTTPITTVPAAISQSDAEVILKKKNQ